MKILDHGHVNLVDSMGSDISIVRNARVSYHGDMEKETPEKTEKLIHYLMTNGHTSPFESVNFTFDIKAPIFVVRQWHRHRTWSYNEVSARYTELTEEFYIPDADKIGVQSEDNKQMRDFDQDYKPTLSEHIQGIMTRSNYDSFAEYKLLLSEGVPRELARSVLPMGTYTHMFASVDLHNLFHFLRLRLHEHAQYEIRVYAEALLGLIQPIVPISTAAFMRTL